MASAAATMAVMGATKPATQHSVELWLIFLAESRAAWDATRGTKTATADFAKAAAEAWARYETKLEWRA